MRLHRQPTSRVPALVIVLILPGVLAAAAEDWSLPGGSRDESAPDRHESARLGPGDTIAWLLADGTLGHGEVAVVDGTEVVTATGLRLGPGNCQALWRAAPSRSAAVGRGLGYGLAVGALAGSAMYATYYEDSPGSFENIGPAFGTLLAVSAGALIGLTAGAAGPAPVVWQEVYAAPDAEIWRAEDLPSAAGPAGRSWPRRPWFELTPTVGSVGWYGHQNASGGTGLRSTLWLSLDEGLDVGAAMTVTGSPDVPGSGGLAGEGLLRLGSHEGEVQPYLVFGLGHYGMLGDTMGFAFRGGLRVMVADHWAVSLEAGSVHGLEEVAGDRPGQATLGLGISCALGGGDAER